MSSGEFCVVCGATDRPLVDGVCPECAADRTRLVTAPKRGTVTVCPQCGARRLGAHWERAGTSPRLDAEDLNVFLEVHPEAGLRTVRWEETDASATVREFVGRAHVVFRGASRDVDVPLSVRVVARTCPECSRKSGKYYTAILQLRGPSEGPIEKATALRERLDRQWAALVAEARPDWRDAVSWREQLPEGWDCYLTETLAARSIARLARQKFGAELKESASLFGRKDGHDVYRVTICLRFPNSSGSSPPGAGAVGSRSARRLVKQ
jgi:nonsense-mediated mRNA decay protein 3